MSREWKPGDVADVWINDRHERAIVRVRREAASSGLEFAYVKGGFDMTDDLAPGWSARPLVVIDPEDREAVERLAALYERDDNPGRIATKDMQAALREFANPTPPKPDEPTGLGAVVEDAKGRKWVRSDETDDLPWHEPDSGDNDWRNYADIPVVRVLSEGVR